MPPEKPDYGVDAPAVMRNLFLIGFACLLGAIVLPRYLHLFGVIILNSRTLFWPAGILIAEGCLFLFYVKVGKFRHRDLMLSLHNWRGDEQVLDVGCGRGLLLAGAARHPQQRRPRHRSRHLVKRRYGSQLRCSHAAQPGSRRCRQSLYARKRIRR